MESPESLTTFAELAIALAGFTGLLTAFQRRQITWSDQQRFRIRMLLLVCFAIMAFALTPKMLVGFVWGLLFAGMFFYATLAIVWRQEDTT